LRLLPESLLPLSLLEEMAILVPLTLGDHSRDALRLLGIVLGDGTLVQLLIAPSNLLHGPLSRTSHDGWTVRRPIVVGVERVIVVITVIT
jgi:hypothetical protein